jgi:hypothetical protein
MFPNKAIKNAIIVSFFIIISRFYWLFSLECLLLALRMIINRIY